MRDVNHPRHAIAALLQFDVRLCSHSLLRPSLPRSISRPLAVFRCCCSCRFVLPANPTPKTATKTKTAAGTRAYYASSRAGPFVETKQYFRHNKFSSFRRQLNLYGYRKVIKGPDAGAYMHPFFQRDRPDLLGEVKKGKVSGAAGRQAGRRARVGAAGEMPLSG